MTIKIGIDFHGVITANPTFFANFNALALKKEYEIYVLSGGSLQDIETYLSAYNIPYSHIWSMVDHFHCKNMVAYFPDGSFKVDDQVWNKAKAAFCLKEGISFHIDDSLLYGQHFKTPFCLYDVLQKKCVLDKNNQVVIDFTQSPEQVLQNIEMQIS